jgi:hypothetical protein
MHYTIRLGTVGPVTWGSRPVAIIGGGPSLKGFDFTRLKGQFTVLAVNASILDLPWADHGFSLDLRAMRAWWISLCNIKTFMTFAVPDNKLTKFPRNPAPHMRFVRRMPGTNFNCDRDAISSGGSSGFGALHLAFQRGAKDIRLFGFDYLPTGHHNDKHYNFPTFPVPWLEFARSFDAAGPVLRDHGVKVLNASPYSAITAFEKCTVEEGLQ